MEEHVIAGLVADSWCVSVTVNTFQTVSHHDAASKLLILHHEEDDN